MRQIQNDGNMRANIWKYLTFYTFGNIVILDQIQYILRGSECMKKKLQKLLWAAIILLLFYVLAGWKMLVARRIEMLEIPEGSEIVYPTKIWISDVYWIHIKGEKVIKCDMDYKAAKEYIEEHNSERALKNIDVYPYGGMSDIAIYEAEFDEMFWQQPDQDNYITISYLRKVFE